MLVATTLTNLYCKDAHAAQLTVPVTRSTP